ncbi:MAG: hypothetical protein M1827_001041 [Pycnora praestabilis]|nr:MAG: hypothetical protein M1827_001041 [Pycnora praestabilis]
MALTGAPLSVLAPCQIIEINKKSIDNSLVKRASTRESKTTKYTHSSPGITGMRFSSAPSKPKVSKQSISFLRKQKVQDGTILKAVPQAGILGPVPLEYAQRTPAGVVTNGPQKSTRAACLLDPNQSKPLPELFRDDAPSIDASIQPYVSAGSPKKAKDESQSEVLGVWKDGAIRLAQDENRLPIEAGVESIQQTTLLEPRTIVQTARRQRPRPKIQLTIPKQPRRAMSVAYVPHQGSTRAGPATASPSPDSPIQAPMGRMNSCTSTRRLSIVSPMTSGTAKAQRPFSVASSAPTMRRLGLERQMVVSHAKKESISASSDDTVDDEDDISSCYSNRSSMSSVDCEASIKIKVESARPLSSTGSVAFSILSPARAGVFDELPPVPELRPTPKCLRSLKSNLSLAELANANTNKPLPPEPIDLEPAPLVICKPIDLEPAPLTIAGRPCSRSTSRSRKSTSPSSYSCSPSPPLDGYNSSPTCPINMPKSRSGRISLKSKYSSTSLDAIDNAFQKASPTQDYVPTTLQDLHEVEEALEAELGTITEDIPFKWDEVSITDEPLQISRGPMHMEPSRSAPTPPPSASSSQAPRDFLQKRRSFRSSQLTHVASLMKSDKSMRSEKSYHRPSSSIIDGHGKWSVKAQKLLRRPSMNGAPLDRSSSSASGSTISHNSRPHSPIISVEELALSEEQLANQRAVAEIHERLEFLMPKEDADALRRDASWLAESWSRKSSITPSEFRLPIQRPSFEQVETPKEEATTEVIPEHEVFKAIKAIIQKEDMPEIVVQDEEGAVKERRGRHDLENPISLVSLAVSEIPEWYANMPPSLDDTQCLTGEEEQREQREQHERQISAQAAERVLLRIMQSLDNLQDLFSTATVSKGFYRTFKRNEMPLMKGALHKMSPAAWELREMTPPYADGNDLDVERPVPEYTPTSYLRYYTRDMYTMVALKSLILQRCESFLRSETISALAGNDEVRSLQLDDAFWRVWTFCKIFGSNKNREDDIVGQMDWLRGGVLAHQQTCRSTMIPTNADFNMNSALLNPPESFGLGNPNGLKAEELYDMTEIWNCLSVLIRGFQGKREQAREYGVFENTGVAVGDIEKEDAVLEEWSHYLLTLGPSVILDLATPSNLPNASAGYALAAENGWTDWETPAFGASRSTFLKEAVTRVYDERMLAVRATAQSDGLHTISTPEDRIRQARHAAEIRARRRSGSFDKIPISEDRPMSGWQEALRRLHAPQVDDPVDKAVFRLVGMGFPVEKARKALATTDTGECLDVEKAIELLVLEEKCSNELLLQQQRQSSERASAEVFELPCVRDPRKKQEIDVAAGRFRQFFG